MILAARSALLRRAACARRPRRPRRPRAALRRRQSRGNSSISSTSGAFEPGRRPELFREVFPSIFAGAFQAAALGSGRHRERGNRRAMRKNDRLWHSFAGKGIRAGPSAVQAVAAASVLRRAAGTRHRPGGEGLFDALQHPKRKTKAIRRSPPTTATMPGVTRVASKVWSWTDRPDAARTRRPHSTPHQTPTKANT